MYTCSQRSDREFALVPFDNLEMVSSTKIILVQPFQALGQHLHLKTIDLIRRLHCLRLMVD
jgi:hypothetical protein